MERIKILSLNVKGLRDPVKRKAIFRWVKKQNSDITFLQETYSLESEINMLKNEWGEGMLFVSEGSTHSKGCIVLIRSGVEITVNEAEIDTKGRYILLNSKIFKEDVIICNIYAPNRENEQISFYSSIVQKIRTKNIDKVILGGDFNITLNEYLDRKTLCAKKKRRHKGREQLLRLIENLELVDIWRKRNPQKRKFTYRNRSLNPSVQSRLDLWLISETLIESVTECKIIPSIAPDHSAVAITLKPEVENQRGPGLWKFNSKLLNDENFIESMKNCIQKAETSYNYVNDARTKWELIKCDIRSFAIKYSKIQKRKTKDKEKDLEKELAVLEEKIGLDADDETLVRYEVVKNALMAITNAKAEGVILRCKARWHEEGEKSTKYFAKLEKRNYDSKYISELQTENNGQYITDPKEILEHGARFYSDLYSSNKTDTQNPKYSNFFNLSPKKKLTEVAKSSLEGELNITECKEALDRMSNGKSPGVDGLTREFYQAFWNETAHLVLNSLNSAYEKREMMIAQNRGIIRLLPKPKKKEELLKIDNWRPISLLNVDYKIGSKALTLRLEKVLPTIIDNNQAGFVKGRFIGECIRTIDDVLHFIDQKKYPGLALFLDFKKAFDCLEHNFIRKTLQSINFGESFIQWYTTLYSNATSCVINNGYTSKYFPIERGVRQGDPLSGSLFVIAVELLANSLRTNKNIRGISVSDKQILLTQYADDTTIFVKDEKSAAEALRVIELFGEVSGLKLNKAKCEGLWLGILKDCQNRLFDISWPQRPIAALGAHFSYNKELNDNINFDEKLTRVETTLKAWSGRGLTPIGKICILKMFGISKLLYTCSNLKVPEDFPKTVNSIISKFVWNFRPPKVKGSTMIQNVRNGGLKMPDMTIMCKSLKILWIKRLLDEENSQWKIIPLHYLEKVGGKFVFHCNYDIQTLNVKLPPVYKEILIAWSDLNQTSPKSAQDVQKEILWNNRFITIDGKSLWWKGWFNQGILRIRDLLGPAGRILSFVELRSKYVIQFWSYMSLIDAIPPEWRKLIKTDTYYANMQSEQDNMKVALKREDTLIPIDKLTNRQIYNIISEKSVKPPTSEKYLIETLGKTDISVVYCMPFIVTKNTTLQYFQFKIIHGFFPTNHYLNKVGKNSTNLCEHCQIIDDLEHYFATCQIVTSIWQQFNNFIEPAFGKLTFSKSEILFGILKTDKKSLSLNWLILLLKQYIYICKWKGIALSFLAFVEKLKYHLKIEKQGENQNQCKNYRSFKWKRQIIQPCLGTS